MEGYTLAALFQYWVVFTVSFGVINWTIILSGLYLFHSMVLLLVVLPTPPLWEYPWYLLNSTYVEFNRRIPIQIIYFWNSAIRDFWFSNKITHNFFRSLQQPLNLSLFFFNVAPSPIQESRDIVTVYQTQFLPRVSRNILEQYWNLNRTL